MGSSYVPDIYDNGVLEDIHAKYLMYVRKIHIESIVQNIKYILLQQRLYQTESINKHPRHLMKVISGIHLSPNYLLIIVVLNLI